MKALTKTILTNTLHAFPRTCNLQGDHIISLFRSYYEAPDNDLNLLDSTASRYYTGARLLPIRLVHYYSDRKHPRCPSKLRKDIERYINDTHDTSLEIQQTLNSLLAFISTLPPEDHQDLLLGDLLDDPSVEKLSGIFTRALWYAICYDHYEAARNKQAG